MPFDIRTLILVISITHVIQFVIFSYQYTMNKSYQGIGWWLLWSASEIAGFIFILLRQIPSIHVAAIIGQNTMIILGVVFLYIGIMRFFDRKENVPAISLIFGAFLVTFLYFILVHDDILIRGIIISATLAAVSFLSAHALLFHRPSSLAISANFTAAFFLAHGSVFAVRSIMVLKDEASSNPFAATPLNVVTYVDAMVVGIVWTFALIFMINQRLNAEMREAKEEVELVFNTSPDAAVISRLSDGFIVYANEGFTTLSGFTHQESIGRTSLDINIWKNPEDRQKIIGLLREKGSVANFESQFQRKDGGLFNGLVSANIINLQKIPHIITVTRDITERKQMEEKLKAMSLTDELTGLYNRRGFLALAEQQLKIAERTRKGMLLFFADLDKMKLVNDTLGHMEGDNALLEVASVLKEAFRDSDIIGRIGGDEFAVLAIEARVEARELFVQRLQAVLAAHNGTERPYQLSLSVGIAHYDPQCPSSLDKLIAQADTSMYEDKRRKDN